MTHTEHIQTIGTHLGITIITPAHGAIEDTTTHGVTDMIHGTMAAITVVTMGDIMEDTIVRGITDTTHGTMVAGMAVSMILGTMATMDMPDSTIHTITTCTHIIADGTEDGIHTSVAFTTDLISEADTELSWAAAARMSTEARATKQLPTEQLPA